MRKAIINLPFVASLSLCAMISSNVLAATEEFTYKPASKHTIEANREAAKRLPYGDKIAFEEQARGLIATFGDSKAGQIREPFHAFLKGVDGIYQLRGHEISNVTFFRTKTGYVVNDQGLLDETMRLGWEADTGCGANPARDLFRHQEG